MTEKEFDDENPWELIGQLMDDFEEKLRNAKEHLYDAPQETVARDVLNQLLLARPDLDEAIEHLRDIVASE